MPNYQLPGFKAVRP